MNLENIIVVESDSGDEFFIDASDIRFVQRTKDGSTNIFLKGSDEENFISTDYKPEEIFTLIKKSREQYAQRKANETMDLISGFSKVFSMLGAMLVPEEKPQRDKEV